MSKSFDNSRVSTSFSELKKTFDYSKFDPHCYVAEYYSCIGEENKFLLNFYHSVYKNMKRGVKILEFGGGPTIYQLLSASEKAAEIVFADYLECNRREVALWLNGDPKAINWDNYIEFVAKLSGENDISSEKFREKVSQKVTRIIECDAHLPDILRDISNLKFDVISTGFCLDCISQSEAEFSKSLKKLAAFLNNGGTLLLTSLLEAESYKIGDISFRAFPISEENLNRILTEIGFKINRCEITNAERSQGYKGIIAIEATLNKTL